MPAKKKKRSKSKDRGDKLDKSKSKPTPEFQFPEDAVPAYIPPPPVTGHQLLSVLQATHNVDEREFLGMKIPSHIFEQLTPQEIRDLKMVFDVFDIDNSNTIDLKELRRAMKVLGFKVTKKQVKEMMANVDSQNKGIIKSPLKKSFNFFDFIMFVLERQGDSRDIFDEIRQGFKIFDIENEGKITLPTLKKMCRENNIKLSEREMRDMIQEANHDGDDAVDEDEFIGIMLKTNLF